jgi:putative ABC transport system permease protein
MVSTIALKSLLHDRTRFLVTAVGIALSLVLVMVQIGLLAGFDRTISAMLDHAKADLWIVPTGTEAFDDPALLQNGERFAALPMRDIERVTPLIVGFSDWSRPGGGTTTVIVVGANPKSGLLVPWDIQSGKAGDLRAPDAVAIDATYADQLGVSKIGDLARIEGQAARVAVITHGIRSFTTSPYIFTSLTQARAYLSAAAPKSSYLAIELAPGANVADVQRRLSAKMPNVEFLTPAEFRWRNVSRWLLDTGAGIALLAGAILAVLVGSVIMTQTLYASVNDHRKEFATLRAMGSSKGFLRAVILMQAMIGTIAGCVLAALTGAVIIGGTANSTMPIQISPALVVVLGIVAFAMATASAIAAASKVARVDPGTVFAQ